MHEHTPRKSRQRVVRFLVDEFDKVTEAEGLDSNVKKAHRVGCGIATMSRIRAGKQNPGPVFIAKVHAAYPYAAKRFFDFHGSES